MTHHAYGAHEVIELHDVLTNTINTIHTFQLYLQSIQDSSLRQIALNQLRFMTVEYNELVHFVHGLAAGKTISYHSFGDWTTGVNQGNVPNALTNVHSPYRNHSMSDIELASCMLTLHKASATMRMHAALECADFKIRQLTLQGAANCAHQAYEVWDYIHSHDHYPVPSVNELSHSHLLHDFSPQPTDVQSVQSTFEHSKSPAETAFSESVSSNSWETEGLDNTNDTSLT
ncbi:spore coat protein [Brevibacillus ginsengisoli]|uniref:spore coat protein n=1 Tax=Brevibacillus ginsengisoli TaxID=363854 RepID=UPI003CE9A490